MKPPTFRYERATTTSEALDLLSNAGASAKVLAGGQSLVALMNLRLSRADVLVDLAPIDELRNYGRSNGHLEIGAMVTQATLEHDPAVGSACPLLASAIPWVGHEAIRNRGTVGGTIAHADPAAELPVVLAALGGEVVVRSKRGGRTIPASEWFRAFLMTSIDADEIVTAVRFPVTGSDTGTAFVEFARRPGDFALVSVAAVVSTDSDGEVDSVRLALGGVAATPLVIDAQEALGGADPAEAAAAAAEFVRDRVDPAGDIHGSAEYRRDLARELTRRAVEAAVSRRVGG